MRRSRLERKLVVGILVLFLIPTVAAGTVLLLLYRQGTFDDNPRALLLAVAIGFAAMMGYLGVMAHAIGRSLVRTIQTVQLGTELIATVNPDHRLDVRTRDELESLATEINRMADRLDEARTLLWREVRRATSELDLERQKLSAVLEGLGQGVAVTTVEGRVVLANRAAQQLLGDGSAVLGRSLPELLDREQVVHGLERIRDGVSASEGLRAPTRGGAVVEAVMTPFVDGERRVAGIVLSLRDVTVATRQQDERHRQLAATLEAAREPLAAIRSLAESLAEAEGPQDALGQRMVAAIRDEATRLSDLVGPGPGAGGAWASHPPDHFEVRPVGHVVALALRRLAPRAGERVECDPGPPWAGLPALRGDLAVLSGALAGLLRSALERARDAAVAWLRVRADGGVVQLEVMAHGMAALPDLDGALEPAIRDVVHRHAGEVWAFADGEAFGFRLTLPAGPAVPEAIRDGAPPRFVGAGTRSGGGPPGTEDERPEFYDFSLADEMARGVSPADRERPLASLECVVLDLETTGLHPEGGDRIVSIAAVRVRDGMVRRGEVFDALVNPGRPIPASSTRIHGITDAMVAAAPPIDVVLPAFLGFAGGSVLVGHEVWFDLRFLGLAAQRLGLPPLTRTHPALDTLLMSESVHGALEGHGLDVVAERLGVHVQGRHSALGDALATADIYVRLLALLRARGMVTLGQVIEASRRVRRTPGR